MSLSEKNVKILMLHLHQKIQEYANYAVSKIIEDKAFDIIDYPPGDQFSDSEIKALKELKNDIHLKSGLTKLIADNSAAVLFDLFNILDGTVEPYSDDEEWSGLKLVNVEPEVNEIEFTAMLHDDFFSTYWDYKDP